MNRPVFWAGMAGLFCLLLGGESSLAQQTPSPEAVIALNEGIHEYLLGQVEPEPLPHFQAAIEKFSFVLEQDADQLNTRLFRGLSYGQIALLERRTKEAAQNRSGQATESSKILADPELRKQTEEQLAEIVQRLEAEDSELDPTEQLILMYRRFFLEQTVAAAKRYEDRPLEELEAEIADENRKYQEAADREKANYESMLADIDHLVKKVKSPDVFVSLLDVVALTKIARISETRAWEVKNGTPGIEPGEQSVAVLRLAADVNLERAARMLEDLLGSHAADADGQLTKAKFFLGVVRFRQAIPRRTKDEPADRDLKRLDQAEELMADLVASEETGQTWHSYAELYLGLINAERGAQVMDPVERTDSFDLARRHLNRAVELDTVLVPGRQPRSASDTIPYIVGKQLELIEQYAGTQATAPFRHDFQLSVYWGANRDTNVVLLGERTDLPRGISDEKDFGFTLGAAFDYTIDLGRLNSSLERWTVGLQGRVSQLWHIDVDQFDEQDYGGSAAVQYELVREQSGFGPIHLRLQYDYDYTLLGRDPFVEAQTLTPNLRVYWLQRRAVSDLFFGYSIRDYREDLYDRRYDRDGEYYQFGFVQTLKTVNMTKVYESWGWTPWGLAGDAALQQDDPDYPARHLTPFIGLRYGWDSTEGDEFDQKAYTLTCGLEMPLPYGMSLDAAADFEWQEYGHGSLIDFHRRPRRDLIQRYSVGLSRTFVLRGGMPANRYELDMDRVLMTVRGHATWTLDDSNVNDRLGQAIFEYDRVVYGITFGFTFN